MSQPAPNTSLSQSARLLCYLGPPSAILLTSLASPRTALLSPLAFLPTAYLFRQWRASNTRNPSRRGELEPMFWTYAATGTIGLASAALIQMALALATSALLFRSSAARKYFLTEIQRSTLNGLTADELTRRAALAASWQNWVFNGALSFGMAALVEETLKYLPIAYARRRGTAEQRQRRSRAYVDYALAGALSFGVIENIAFIYAACEKKQEAWPRLVLTLFERMVVGSVGHLLMASLTALRAIRRDYDGERLTFLGVVGPAVVMHGTFDFVALTCSAREGNVGWIHPTWVGNTAAMFGLLGGLVVTTAWQVRQEWKALDERDQKRK
ncbi:hypothetical protein MMC13_007586 [Lambiella insularis]|nr:hypothetical protein [Lambiella insularis]